MKTIEQLSIEELMERLAGLDEETLYAPRIGFRWFPKEPEPIQIQRLESGTIFQFLNGTEDKYVYCSEAESRQQRLKAVPYRNGRWFRPHGVEGELMQAEYGTQVIPCGHIHG